MKKYFQKVRKLNFVFLIALPFLSLGQKVNYNSEVAKLYVLADKTICQNFSDNFTHTFNYVLNNTRDLKDYNQIKENAIKGDKDYYERKNLRFTPYVFKEPTKLGDYATQNGHNISADLKSFLRLLNGAIEKSSGYEVLSADLIKIIKSTEFTRLSMTDKKIASGIVVCIDYTAQSLPDLLGKLESKTNLSFWLNDINGPVSHAGPYPPAPLYSTENYTDSDKFIKWGKVIMCALGTAGGAATGALTGAAAGSVVPGVGTAAGAAIGAAAGAASGAAATCF
jgi:hypothetical protein